MEIGCLIKICSKFIYLLKKKLKKYVSFTTSGYGCINKQTLKNYLKICSKFIYLLKKKLKKYVSFTTSGYGCINKQTLKN